MNTSKIEQKLSEFLECHQEMERKTDELKAAVKSAGVTLIAEHLRFERSADAKAAIDSLDEAKGMTYMSNALDIQQYIMGIFKTPRNDITSDKPVQSNATKTALDEGVAEFTMDSVKSKLTGRGFEFIKNHNGMLDFKKGEDHFFIKPFFHSPEETSYRNLLSEHFRFRNIAFLTKTHDEKVRLKNLTNQWVSENRSKFTYLCISFATMEEIEMTEDFFDTVDYSIKNKDLV